MDDLRTISLADAGALPLARTHFPLGDAVSTVVESFLARAQALDVRVVAEPGAEGVMADADRDRLTQAIAALVDNAVRHAPPTSVVTVRVTRPSSGGGRVEVVDQGPGIADADLPHLFDRFYQADAARNRETGTSGLGLAIVRAIAEAHGGRVGVANDPTGGAVFWLDIPCPPAARTRLEPEPPEPPRTARTAPNRPAAQPSARADSWGAGRHLVLCAGFRPIIRSARRLVRLPQRIVGPLAGSRSHSRRNRTGLRAPAGGAMLVLA